MRAKRVAPTEVPPVQIGNVRYEVVHWGRRRGWPQNGGYIVACDAATGKELWTLQVYESKYDDAMESDVQDVFITAMSRTLFGGKLSITDENGRMYRVDPATRTVERR